MKLWSTKLDIPASISYTSKAGTSLRVWAICLNWWSNGTKDGQVQQIKSKKIKCRSIVTKDSCNIDTRHIKLGVSDFKWEYLYPDSNHTFKLDILNPVGSKDATRLKDMESGFSRFNHSITPSFQLRRFDGTHLTMSQCKHMPSIGACLMLLSSTSYRN